MNVLVLEDRGSVGYYLKEALTEEGHSVYFALTVSDAISHLDEERIDCIVIDLNMSPEGLNDEEVGATLSGLLTGWIWLRNHVYAGRNADMRERTIIYTEYMDQLRYHVPEEELRGIHLIPKRGFSSTAEQLLNTVRQIAGLGRRAA